MFLILLVVDFISWNVTILLPIYSINNVIIPVIIVSIKKDNQTENFSPLFVSR